MNTKMHIECLPKNAREVFLKLKPVLRERAFVLGGGTALALQIGHRISVDLDLFSEKEFSTEHVHREIKKLGMEQKILQEEKGTLTISINGVMVSLFHYPYPFIDEKKKFDGVSISGIIDIASMKVVAIGQRGAKRDFCDLYFILQDVPFWKVAENMAARYGKDRLSPLHTGKSLVYFEDAEGDPEPRYIIKDPPEWKTIRNFFKKNAQQMTLDLQKAAR